MLNRGMFIYPWDVAHDPHRFVSEYQQLGCNMVAVNAVYHQCNVLGTRAGHVYERNCAGTSFAIHPEMYGRILPRVVSDLTGELEALRTACIRQGIDWRCWVVSLHNDQIGEAYPDTTVRNVWGDRYPSALCVNHPDVREYADAAVRDVIGTLAPSRVVMESLSFMHAFHGRHHEFSLARMTGAVRYLLSLCFCEHCKRAAEQQGVDAHAAQRTAERLLRALTWGDTTFEGSEDAQLMQLFLEYPELYAYQRFRMESVRSLVAQVAKTAHDRGVLLDYIPSAAPFTIHQMQYDASSFSALQGVVDGFVPLCYSPAERYPLIRRNVQMHAPGARVSLALNLDRRRYTDAGDLCGRIAEAVEDGVEDIYCYNYGLATPECLGWMGRAYRQAAKAAGEREGKA